MMMMMMLLLLLLLLLLMMNLIGFPTFQRAGTRRHNGRRPECGDAVK